MTGGRRRRAPPTPSPDGVLDWRSSSHWSHTPAPCRYCARFTHLRDTKGSPAHKVCAEAAIAQQAAEAADAYENERLAPD